MAVTIVLGLWTKGINIARSVDPTRYFKRAEVRRRAWETRRGKQRTSKPVLTLVQDNQP